MLSLVEGVLEFAAIAGFFGIVVFLSGIGGNLPLV